MQEVNRTNLQVGRQSHVDFFSIGSDSVQHGRVVQRAIPGSLELEKYPEEETHSWKNTPLEETHSEMAVFPRVNFKEGYTNRPLNSLPGITYCMSLGPCHRFSI